MSEYKWFEIALALSILSGVVIAVISMAIFCADAPKQTRLPMAGTFTVIFWATYLGRIYG